jgi:peptide-methionine (S)-S-oxide reductase
MKQIVWLMLALSVAVARAGEPSDKKMNTTNTTELATFGGGCFWCLEAVFERLDGVESVTSGYAGGKKEKPTYQEVCSGNSGHAEVVQIAFDAKRISYDKLLEIFWAAHDPTTMNRQGADVGTQYRSVIFYHSEAQKAAAEKSKETAQWRFPAPIVTEIVPLTRFYKAEDYHQDYFRNHPNAPYCAVVISPKLEKLKPKLAKP